MSAKTRGPHLVVYKGNLTGRIYELTKKETVVGRDPVCDVIVSDVSVSRTHIRITLIDDHQPVYTIEDLGSTNGTFVNGQQISGVQPLNFGDEIVLASDVFVLLKDGVFRKPQKPEEPPDTVRIPRVNANTRRVDNSKYAGLTLEDLSPADEAEAQHDPDRLSTEEATIPDYTHVFISYSRKDAEVMERIYNTLQEARLRVWVDKKLEPGVPSWRRAIEKAIDTAGCIVLILSPDAKASKWVEAELDYAETQGKKIFCVLARGDKGSSALLGYTLSQWVNLQKDYDAAMQELIAAVRKYLKLTES
jgi:pSer/pThr/pTyr-binding forkhead associated (FHA) protein